MTSVVSDTMIATSWLPSPTDTPMAPVAHRLAAVAVPVTAVFSRRMAPPPMKPMPVISPSTMRAIASGLPTTSVSDAWMKPQVAIATSGKVRRPALRADRSRFQPIGSAST